MSSCSHRVVQLRTPLTEEERLSLIEQTVLCHPAVHSVELVLDEQVHAEVVVWRGSSQQRTVRDISAALDAVVGEVAVSVTAVAVAYRRRERVLWVYN